MSSVTNTSNNAGFQFTNLKDHFLDAICKIARKGIELIQRLGSFISSIFVVKSPNETILKDSKRPISIRIETDENVSIHIVKEEQTLQSKISVGTQTDISELNLSKPETVSESEKRIERSDPSDLESMDAPEAVDLNLTYPEQADLEPTEVLEEDLEKSDSAELSQIDLTTITVDFDATTCTEEQRKAINYIIETTANADFGLFGIGKLKAKKNNIQREKEKIENVHPLRFLLEVFKDKTCKENISTIFSKGDNRGIFLNGSKSMNIVMRAFSSEKGFASKMNDKAEKEEFDDYLQSFIISMYPEEAQRAEHESLLKDLARQRSWESFIQYLIEHTNL